MDFDYERAFMLLSIVEKVSTVAPGYTAITGEAMAELRQMNQGILDAQAKARGEAPPPAPYGDDDSPLPPQGASEGSDQLSKHPTSSAPVANQTEAEPDKPIGRRL